MHPPSAAPPAPASASAPAIIEHSFAEHAYGFAERIQRDQVMAADAFVSEMHCRFDGELQATDIQ